MSGWKRLLGLALLAACGGGGGPAGNATRVVALLQVTFPPGPCCTDAARVHVCGTAVNGEDIAVLRVNGKSAFTRDGYANWAAEVDLAQGVNDVAVECVTHDGTVIRDAGPRILRYATPLAPLAIGALPDEDAVVMLDADARAVVRVDTETGVETVVSGPGVGAGPDLVDPVALVLAPDREKALVFDFFECQLVEAALSDGNRVAVMGERVFRGPEPGAPPPRSEPVTVTAVGWDGHLQLTVFTIFHVVPTIIRNPPAELDGPTGSLDVGADEDRIVVSGDVDRVALIDRRTGAREFFDLDSSVVASASLVDPARHRILVADSAANEIHQYSFAGLHRVVSKRKTIAGPEHEFAPFPAMVLDTARDTVWMVAADLRGLVGIAANTGARTALRTTGSELRDVSDMAYDGLRDRLLCCSHAHGRAWEVSLATGDVRPLRNYDVTAGPDVGSLGAGLCWDGGLVLAADEERSKVVAFDPAAARREHVVDVAEPIAFDAMAGGMKAVVVRGIRDVCVVDLETGAERAVTTGFNGVVAPVSVAVDEGRGRALVLDALHGGVVHAFDLATGESEVLAAPSSPDGIPLLRGAIAIEDGDAAAVFSEPGRERVQRLDLETGEATVLSAPAVGSGAPLTHPAGIACRPGGGVLVIDQVTRTLVAIEAGTLVRTVVSGAGRGSGPEFESPGSVAVDGQRALVTDGSRVFAVDLGSGDRVLVSR